MGGTLIIGDYVVDGGILDDSWAYDIRLNYVFTQQYIWEKLGQDNATFLDSGVQAKYVVFKSDIDSQMENMTKRPSFDGKVIELDIGETKTVTDTLGVLADYKSVDRTIEGIRFQHTQGSNTLNITITESCTLEQYRLTDGITLNWNFIKDGTEDKDTTVYFQFREGVQDQLWTMDYNDPVPVKLELKINQFGKLEITKTNTNKDLIDGAVFNLKGANYNQNIIVTSGKITVDKLKKGTYTLKEITAPNGYLLNMENYAVTINPNQTTTQTVIDTEPTGTINLTKRDSEKGAIPQGDGKLENATYQVFANEDIYNKAHTIKHYSKGDLVATRTTSSTGTMESVTNLPLGKYVVKEITPSLGYLLDTTVYTVNLEYANQNTTIIIGTVTSNEIVKKQKIHIFKSGINEHSGEVQGLQGAEFTIKLFADVEKAKNSGYTYSEIWNGIDENGNPVTVNSTRVAKAQSIAPTYDTITTDSEGNAYTKYLPFGKYITKETKTPKDFVTAIDFTFTVSQDESEIIDVAKKVKDIFVNNEQMESYIKLVKRDLKTNKIVTLSSSTFQIKATKDIYDRGANKILYKKGEVISQKIGSKIYTSFTTNGDNVIVPNDSYSIKDEDKGTVVTPLSLPVGNYEITEIQVPNGFLQLEKPITFNIENIRSYDTDKYGDYIQEVIIKNEQPTGTILLNKKVNVRENVDKSLVDVSYLSKIKFRLTAKQDVIDMADGSIIYKKDSIVGEYNLKADGTLRIENLPLGTYEMQEIATLDGLVLNDMKYEFKFTYTDTTTKVYTLNLDVENDTTLFEISKKAITGEDELIGAKLEVKDSEGKIIDSWTSSDKAHTIEGLITGKTYTLTETIAPEGYVISNAIQFTVGNTSEVQQVTMIDKQVKVSKTDIATGEKLEGAELEIQDKEGNIIDSWISTKEPHFVSGLIEGKTYILVEKVAPYFYLLTESIEFTVSSDKETQVIEMKDEQVVLDINIEKYGFIETQSKDTIFYDFKNIENKSNTYLDNFTWQDTIPTNALRMGKIYTGTWNQDLQYSIWYKTNTNDYRLFKDNLSTNTNYEIQFSEAKLSEGEFITEFEFRFGRVDIGFKEVDSPILYCKMLDGLGDGFVFTNNTRVSGSYLDKTIEDKDKWTTTTYFKEIKLDKLPRTGF